MLSRIVPCFRDFAFGACQVDPWAYEKAAWAEGFEKVVGVDEAGLGPLAGPVVAAAVLLPRDFDAEGVGDSKAMTPLQREGVFERIIAEAAAVGVGIIDRETIDRINILRAAHAAMKAALKQLSVAFDCVLVDGRPVRDLHAEVHRDREGRCLKRLNRRGLHHRQSDA